MKPIQSSRWSTFFVAACLFLLPTCCHAFNCQNHKKKWAVQQRRRLRHLQLPRSSSSPTLASRLVPDRTFELHGKTTALFSVTNGTPSSSPAGRVPPGSSTGSTSTPHHQQQEEEDSLERLMADVAKVCNELRPGSRDPTLPAPFRSRRVGYPSFTMTWSFDEWNRHLSRRRYLRWLFGFFKSRLLRRVLPMLTIYTVWCSVAVWLCNESVKSQVAMPLSTLSLLITFVAFLLTLRSNQGLGRLHDGRKALGEMVLYTRDMSSLIAFTIYPRNPQVGLKLIRHVALFGWLLKGFLRDPLINGSDEDIIRTMLPNSADADFCLRQRKRPVAVISQLRQAFFHLGKQGQLSTAEEIALDHCTTSMNHVIMVTEKILNSPIPPLYTGLTGRLMMFYLFWLPFALRATHTVGGVKTVIICTAVGYAMTALDEMSYLCEQPFRLMPLYQLSKNSMMDVADSVVQLPPSYETGQDVSSYCPAYWPTDES